MPGGDGFELIRAIREREVSHTPAIAMTGLASNSDRSAAIRGEFDEHLTKPIDSDVLVRSVRLLALSRGMELRREPEDR